MKVLGTLTTAVMLIAILSLPARAIPVSGLVASYPFNGNANDTSGHGKHGVVSGAVLTADRCDIPNSAYLFDDITDVINLPPGMFGSSAGTISLWLKNTVTVTSTTGGSIFPFLASEAPVGGVARQLSLAVGDFTGELNGEILGDLGGTGPPNPRSAVAATQLPSIPAGWHHLVLTSDASGHQFYYDDVAFTPTLFAEGLSATSNLWPLDAAITWIGGVGSQDNMHRDYAVDDVHLYDRALSGAEVHELFDTVCPVPDCSDGRLLLSCGILCLAALRGLSRCKPPGTGSLKF